VVGGFAGTTSAGVSAAIFTTASNQFAVISYVSGNINIGGGGGAGITSLTGGTVYVPPNTPVSNNQPSTSVIVYALFQNT
jgi:hypothetical protein